MTFLKQRNFARNCQQTQIAYVSDTGRGEKKKESDDDKDDDDDDEDEDYDDDNNENCLRIS